MMNHKITEEWLADVFEKLVGLFNEEDVRALDIPGMEESDNLAGIAAKFYARRTFDAIREEMEHIPTDTRIDLETFRREASKESISRLKGFIFYYQAITRSEGFGVTEISELWLLEDGRFAEVTSVGFVKDGQYYFHRKFRNIVKHRNDIWFEISNLEDALFLIALKSVQYEAINYRKQKG